MMKTLFTSLWLLTAAAEASMAASAPPGNDSDRLTSGVALIRRVKPAMAALFAPGENESMASGAGTVIHPAGFILTADHVVTGHNGFAIFGLTRESYRVVGRLPEKDLTLLKVESPSPRKYVPLGRSKDIWDGEPVIAVGNPSGRGLVYSQGIVSAASIDPTWPSLLHKTYWRIETTNHEDAADGRDDFIQFDAASNRGNSGGPLLNSAGELIGIVAQKSFDEQGVNWAIPVD